MDTENRTNSTRSVLTWDVSWLGIRPRRPGIVLVIDRGFVRQRLKRFGRISAGEVSWSPPVADRSCPLGHRCAQTFGKSSRRTDCTTVRAGTDGGGSV